MKCFIIIAALLMGFSSVTHAQKNAIQKKVLSQVKATNVVEDSLKAIVKKAENGDASCQNIVGSWYYKGEHYKQDYRQAYYWWAKSAAQDNVDALGNLGLLFQKGQGVEADSTKALRCYYTSIKKGNVILLKQREKLAEKGGDAFNGVLVAICYQKGYGVDRSLRQAAHFYELAAQCNSVDACRELGFIYSKTQNQTESQKKFEQAAAMGDMVSAYQYAHTALASNIPQDEELQAVDYLIKAAEAGNIQAQCDLGTFYYQGKHVEKNPQEAVKWLRSSANGDWALAQWNLAMCYMDGVGIERDYNQAVYWLGEATVKGCMPQFENMCEDKDKGWKEKPFMSYLKGLALYFTKDIDGAYKEFQKIKKTVEAQTMMCVCMADKGYKKQNAKKAVKQLKKIADKGDASAKYYLASFYEEGLGVEKDAEKAVDLYKQLADAGNAMAQCRLGNIYFEGNIVKQNYSEAVKYFQQAENQNQMTEIAAMQYAHCLEKGLGDIKADSDKATRLKKKDYSNHAQKMLQKMRI